MTRQSGLWGKHTRQRVAIEAARIMHEEHIGDFELARRKAAERLRVKQRHDLPNNQEIQQELLAYRAIFSPQHEACDLQKLRTAALEGMKFLAAFDPRLVGAVLDGTAGPHDDVKLHVFSEQPEEVVLFLLENSIEFEQGVCQVRYKSGKSREVQCLHFDAGDVHFELQLFSLSDKRQPPLCRVSGETMHRADRKKLEVLLATA